MADFKHNAFINYLHFIRFPGDAKKLSCYGPASSANDSKKADDDDDDDDIDLFASDEVS